MAEFWFNHFNVFMNKGLDRVYTASFVEQTIRPNALGTFHDLLLAVATSPAMLFYLDNVQSVTPGSEPPGLAKYQRANAGPSGPTSRPCAAATARFADGTT